MRFKASLGLLLALALLQLPSAGAASVGDGPDLSTAIDTAIAHVRANAASFSVTAADLTDLAVTDAYPSEHNGVTHVYLRQRLNRLEVLDANMTVAVGRDGKVFHTGSRLIGNLAASASGGVALSPTAAFTAAVAHLRALAPRETAAPKIVYQSAGSALRLAWNLEIEDATNSNWWNVSVDAQTGDVLKVYDYVVHDERSKVKESITRTSGVARPTQSVAGTGAGTDGASYRVYALPLESPNDGPRTLQTNPSLPAASPYGWHDMNGVPGPESTSTNGNNVNAAWDPISDPLGVVNTGQLLGLGAEGGASLTFDHPIDLTMPPTLYKEAAVTNLFYWNNIIHDVFYGYGFEEQAGNFQVNQYGKWITSRGNDPVQADAQDGGGVDNANFGTPPDGRKPRMQMYIWSNGRRVPRDGDLDAGVIVHEYGHGISNRLTGGPTNVSCLGNAEQGGEGWSDFLAIAATARAGDVGSTKRGLGTYAIGQASRSDGGIRPTPYRSTSTSPNYESIKSSAVPHGVGYVWASMLWDMYWALSDAHGFNPDVYGGWATGGNNRAIQLVLDGMKLQPCSPGFVDSRDAILAADVALTAGADRCRIWRAFARRGLGLGAIQGSSGSVTDGVQAFNIPVDC